MSAQSIRRFYTEDHQELDALFHQFQTWKSLDFEKAQEAFRKFKAGLERHIAWEEQILFPAFDQRFGHLQGSPTAVMRWEHREITKFLEAIAVKLAGRDLDTGVEETGLQSVLCPHNQKEESILYPTIDQVVSEQEQSRIFAMMKLS